jgi:hypothetical protein
VIVKTKYTISNARNDRNTRRRISHCNRKTLLGYDRSRKQWLSSEEPKFNNTYFHLLKIVLLYTTFTKEHRVKERRESLNISVNTTNNGYKNVSQF